MHLTTRSGNNKKTLDKINKLTIALLANSISFAIGKNSVYTAIDIIKIVVYASIRSLSIEGASDELMNLCSTKTCSADVIQTRLSQKSETEIFNAFENTQEKIYIHLRKMRLLFCNVTVAIDFTDKIY